MTTTTMKWEVAGKSKGKSGVKTVSKKNQKNSFQDGMPRIETAPPVKESPTIYDAFREKSPPAPLANKELGKFTNGAVANGKKPSTTTRSKKVGGEKKVSVTLEEAAKQLDATEMETMLSKDQTTFPDSPSVWMKDLASLLNLRLDNVAEPDPVFEGKEKDYPVCLLPAAVRKILQRTLKQCSDATLELFFEHCLNSMISDMGKGVPTYGYRMFIQLVSSAKPDIAMLTLSKSLELIWSHQNRPVRCLAIMWAAGQVGKVSLAKGLKVWLELMLPVLNIRALSKYAVRYLQELLAQHKDVRDSYDVISFRNFFPILDLVFKTSSTLPVSQQKDLLALYPKIKMISFGGHPESQLRNFFPSFLARAEPNIKGPLKAEVLSCLVECLSVDKQCFSVWRQMYTKHIHQSSELLTYLVGVLERSRLDRKLLRDTVQAFSITNEELGVAGRTSPGDQHYQQCRTTCKVLLEKLSSMGFPWKLVIFLLLSTVGGLLAYDCYVHEGFQKSRTHSVLDDTGILLFAGQVGNRITTYSSIATEWLHTNVPVYYAGACEVCGPYLALCWDKMYGAGLWTVAAAQPAKVWFEEKAPQVVEWVNEKVPAAADSCKHYAVEGWTKTVETSTFIVQEKVPELADNCKHYAVEGWLIVQEKVPELADNCKHYAVEGWLIVQEKVPEVADSCKHYAVESWHKTVETSSWVWHHSGEAAAGMWQQSTSAANATGEWLLDNVFTGLPVEEKCHQL